MRYCKRIAWMKPEEIDLLNKGVDFKVSNESISRMNDALIFNINQVVQPEDVLWVLGDWCFGTRQFPARLHELRGRVHCRTCHLIFGNHDFRKVVSPFFASSYEKVAVAIAEDGRYWVGEDEIGENKDARKAQKMILDHYPNASWNGSGKSWWMLHGQNEPFNPASDDEDRWMLHGHCHNNLFKWTNEHMPNAKILDVGVDGHDYKPWSFDEIKKYMDKRGGFSADHHK